MLKQGEIVQITNKEHRWFPCLLIVEEAKKWGIQGYVIFPMDNDGHVSRAYLRVNKEDIEKVGKAIYIAG